MKLESRASMVVKYVVDNPVIEQWKIWGVVINQIRDAVKEERERCVKIILRNRSRLQNLRVRLFASEAFRENDLEEFRQGVAACQKRLAVAQKTIDDFAKESLKHKDKLCKAEEQVIRGLKKAGDLQAELGRVEVEAARYKAALEKISSGSDMNTSRIEIAQEALKER